MIPVIVLVICFAGFRIAGIWLPYFSEWQFSLRAALGAMFVLTASAHWGRRRGDLKRMVPPAFGNAGIWVTVTGIAEIVIAIGLQIPQVAMLVAVLAAIMLGCIFPANVKAARESLTIGGRNVPGLGVRVVIQLIFLAALGASVWRT